MLTSDVDRKFYMEKRIAKQEPDSRNGPVKDFMTENKAWRHAMCKLYDPGYTHDKYKHLGWLEDNEQEFVSLQMSYQNVIRKLPYNGRAA